MNEPEDLLAKKRILIVDDDKRNTFALVSYLETMGMDIHTAENGYEALEMLDGHKNIEIILMDMMMPDMDGYETIGRIKKNMATSSIPIIAVTARAMKGDREKCLEAGASEYVSKPVNLKELVEKITMLV